MVNPINPELLYRFSDLDDEEKRSYIDCHAMWFDAQTSTPEERLDIWQAFVNNMEAATRRFRPMRLDLWGPLIRAAQKI